MKYINRKFLKNISLTVGLLSLFFTTNNANAAHTSNPVLGDATTYEIRITKIEICESSACTTPLTIGSSSKEFNIASAAVGAEIGTYAPLNTIPKGTTATHMRVTMSRAIDIAGVVDGIITFFGPTTYKCGTDSTDTTSTITAGGVGEVGGNGTSAQTLYVPDELAIRGVTPAAGTYAAAGITLISATEMRMLQSLGKTVTMGDIPPVIDIAFYTEDALQAVNDGLDGCIMLPGVPTVEITITEFD